MNCRKCGKVLRAGAQKCPYCGTVVPAPGKRTDTEFNWDLTDSSGSGSGSLRTAPKKKKTDLTFDWNTEKRPNADTDKGGFQSANRWKEPEEARQLFSFDLEHEKLQSQINQKMDVIAAEKPAPAIERTRRDDLFVLPAEMTMDDFSDLLGESIVQESDSVLVVSQSEKGRQKKKPSSPGTRPSVVPAEPAEPVRQVVPESEKPTVVSLRTVAAPERDLTAPDRNQQATSAPMTVVQIQKSKKEDKQRSPEDQAYDPFIGKNFLSVPEMPMFLTGVRSLSRSGMTFVSGSESGNDSSDPDYDMDAIRDFMGKSSPDELSGERGPSLTAIDPGYTPEEEKLAVENFQNLINAEEEFSEKVSNFTFMSDEENARADGACQRWEELSNEPGISFLSLEEEYRKQKESGNVPPMLWDEEESVGTESTIDDSEADEAGLETVEAVPEPETESPEENEPESVDTEDKDEDSDDTVLSAGKVRKAVDLVRKTAGRAAAVAEESVRSLVSEDDEEDDHLDHGVFPAISIDEEGPSETDNRKPVFSRKEKRKPRELNIRINEPTGTQVKVRTEEVDLSDQEDRLRDTQEVNLGKLKEGPKSVRVQVEVNHTSSNSSVEVTRSNDGSTVVKTVEEGTEKEHLYDASGEALLYGVTENASFWEKNEIPEDGLELTGVFSQKMLEFKDQWETEEEQRREEGLETVVRAPEMTLEETAPFLIIEPESEEQEETEERKADISDESSPDTQMHEGVAETGVEEIISSEEKELSEVSEDSEYVEADEIHEMETAETVETEDTEAVGMAELEISEAVETADTEVIETAETEKTEEAEAVVTAESEIAEAVETADTEVIETAETEKTEEAEAVETDEPEIAEAVETADAEVIETAETEKTEEAEVIRTDEPEIAEAVETADTEVIETVETADTEAIETVATAEPEASVTADTDEEETVETIDVENVGIVGTDEAETAEVQTETGEAEEQEVQDEKETVPAAESAEQLTEPEKTEEENTKKYKDLTMILPTDEIHEKIQEEEVKQGKEQPDHAVQANEEGFFKRSGKISFKYKKSESEPEELPVEADRKPDEKQGALLKTEDREADDQKEETGEMQNLFDTMTIIRNRIANVIGIGEDEDDDDEELVSEKTGLTTEETDREVASDEEDAETEHEGRWSVATIMRIVIYILIVAIVIEFLVIGIKLFAPNSQGAVLINRIEQTISGEDIRSTISVDSYTLEDGTEAYVPDQQQ